MESPGEDKPVHSDRSEECRVETPQGDPSVPASHIAAVSLVIYARMRRPLLRISIVQSDPVLRRRWLEDSPSSPSPSDDPIPESLPFSDLPPLGR